MLLHIIKKIKANMQIIVFQYLYIFVTILVVFLLMGFRDAAVNKIESEINFYEKSVIINTNVTNQYYPQGFKLTNEDIEIIKNRLQYVSLVQSVSMDVSLTQHVKFKAISGDFLNTGVPCYNRTIHSSVIEKVELLYGSVWEVNSKAPVVVIDDKTAELIFGYKNVVGQSLPTIHGDLKIIGVVSSTNERNQEIDQAIKEGQQIDEHMFSTNAYISFGYLSTLENIEMNNSTLIVSDPKLTIDDLKLNIKNILAIPLNDTDIIISKQELIDKEITSRKVFFQIIISLTGVFAFLGIINLINVSIFSYRINKKAIGIYKVVGYSNNQLLFISFIEGSILGLGSSVISIIIGFIFITFGTLIAKTFPYLNFTNLFIVALLIILIFTSIVLIINFLTTLFCINKKPLYYLKGEQV